MIAPKQIYKINPISKTETSEDHKSGKKDVPYKYISKPVSCEFRTLFDTELDKLQKKGISEISG